MVGLELDQSSTQSGSPITPYTEVSVAGSTYKVSVSLRTAREIARFAETMRDYFGSIDTDDPTSAEEMTDALLDQIQNGVEDLVTRVLRRFHTDDEIDDLLDIAMLYELMRMINGLSTDEEFVPNFMMGLSETTSIPPGTTPTPSQTQTNQEE